MWLCCGSGGGGGGGGGAVAVTFVADQTLTLRSRIAETPPSPSPPPERLTWCNPSCVITMSDRKQRGLCASSRASCAGPRGAHSSSALVTGL